ncbi:hypothetical protein [Streptomyces lydicus]|uniref:hypothetical protein n=1 Tax=Streptomyces lydicus TaxID=47763 RepID=UPI0037874653
MNYTYLPDVGKKYVEGRVVEPIAVALAELMINATTYSSDEVTVYVQQVQPAIASSWKTPAWA